MVRQSTFATGIALGVGIGTALGVALHNLPMGVALGAALGVTLGLVLQRRRNGAAQCGPTSGTDSEAGQSSTPSTRR
jgi:F0F1-type ATP synthase assembly protein I